MLLNTVQHTGQPCSSRPAPVSLLPKLRNMLHGNGGSTCWVFGVWCPSSVSGELPADSSLRSELVGRVGRCQLQPHMESSRVSVIGPKERTRSRNGIKEKKNSENFPATAPTKMKPVDKLLGMEENHEKVGHVLPR